MGDTPPPLDHHDSVFLREGHRTAPIRTFIELCTPGEGPQGREASHHAAVLELMPDGVCVVWAGFLEEPLEVVLGRPRLMLVTACGGQDVPHVGAVSCGHRGQLWSWPLEGVACASFCRP
jgi:hypothetical protein